MPNQVTKEVIVKIKAFSDASASSQFRALEENAKKTGRNVNEVIDALGKMRTPVRTVGQAVSSLFLDMKKGATEGEKKISELSNTFKRLGLSVRDVQAIAKDLGKEFNLSAAQIERAMGAARGGGGGMGMGAGRMMGVGGAFLGTLGLASGAIGHLEQLNSSFAGISDLGMMLSGRGGITGGQGASLLYGNRPGGWNTSSFNRFSAGLQGGMQTLGLGSLYGRGRETDQQGLVTYFDPQLGHTVTGTATDAANAGRRHAGQTFLNKEEAYGFDISVRGSGIEQARQMGLQSASTADVGRSVDVTRAAREAEITKYSRLGREMAAMQRRAAPAEIGGFGGIAGVGLTQQAEAAQRFGIGAGQRIGESQGGVFRAEQERNRLLAEAVRLESEFRRVSDDSTKSWADKTFAAHQMVAAIEQAKAAQGQFTEATRQHAQLQKDINLAWRENIHQQVSSVRSMRVAEEERTKDRAAELAFSAPEIKLRLLNIAQRLKAGPGPGRNPFWRINQGRVERMPGFGTDLAPEDVALARQYMPNLFREVGGRVADRDPMWKQLQETLKSEPGFGGLAQQLGTAERQLAKIQADVEAKISIDESSLEKELRDKLVPELVRQFQLAIDRVNEQTATEFARQSHFRQANREAQFGQ